MNKKCENCRFARFKDEGYSNYTVEGTTFECMINKHPDGKFDRWYEKMDGCIGHCGAKITKLEHQFVYVLMVI